MNEGIIFKSPEHTRRLVEVVRQIGRVYGGGKVDPEYASALYVLTADLSTWEKAQDYVTCDGIFIEAMLEEVDWSGGHQVLVQWAGNLFNNQQQVSPVELMRLDESNFQVAMSALKVRRYGLRLADVRSE